jgi:hypothetical protein
MQFCLARHLLLVDLLDFLQIASLLPANRQGLIAGCYPLDTGEQTSHLCRCCPIRLAYTYRDSLSGMLIVQRVGFLPVCVLMGRLAMTSFSSYKFLTLLMLFFPFLPTFILRFYGFANNINLRENHILGS